MQGFRFAKAAGQEPPKKTNVFVDAEIDVGTTRAVARIEVATEGIAGLAGTHKTAAGEGRDVRWRGDSLRKIDAETPATVDWAVDDDEKEVQADLDAEVEAQAGRKALEYIVEPYAESSPLSWTACASVKSWTKPRGNSDELVVDVDAEAGN